MSDMAYIMETQDPRELWLVDGENKFKISRDMYWLLASKGADLPPTHHITELLNENDKLRELVRDMMQAWWACDNERCPRHDKRCEEGKFCAFDECARDLGIEVDE